MLFLSLIHHIHHFKITLMRIPIFLFLFIGILMLASCSKDNSTTWKSDWILPLAKTKVSFESLKVFSEVKTTISIPSIDIGYASGVSVNVPAFTQKSSGPYKIPLSSWIKSVNFDSLEIIFRFNNLFPIVTGAGTKFSFRKTSNMSDPNNIIYQYHATQDIAAYETIEFDIKVANNNINDTVYLFLESFNSPGSNNVTFSSTPSTIDLELKILDIDYVDLYSNKSIDEIDTVALDFADEESPIDTSNYGKVMFYVDNGMPINFAIQLYFLDNINSAIIDSLLAPTLDVVACSTDAAGAPINVITKKSEVSISAARIDKIKRCKKGILLFKLNTMSNTSPVSRINDLSFLKMQIAGDLHLSINQNSFN